MSAPPIKFQWDGEAMVPASNFWRRQSGEAFVVGERYRLVEENERSTISHNHEFAWLKQAWDSLPDHLLPQYPSEEHLRKQALIAKGHCTMVQHPCPTEAEAERLQATLRTHADPYAVIVRRRNVVTVYTAVSQSKRAMGGPEFQRSKQDVLDYVADLLGVDPDALADAGKAAA